MKQRRILVSMSLFFLATTWVLPAQEVTAQPGLAQTVRLYDEEGKAFLDSLEKNLYGPQKNEALTLQGSVYLFSPTDPKDHLATRFLPLPPPTQGKPRVATISLFFSQPDPPGSSLAILVQGGGFVTLANLRARPDGSASSVSHDVSIPDSAGNLRLVFLSPDNTPVLMPARVRVQLPSPGAPVPGPGLSTGSIVLISIGIAAAAVLFQRMRKR